MMGLALLVALSLGLTNNFPTINPSTRSNLTILILAIMMTVSLSRIPFKGLNPAKELKSVLRAVVLGTVVASCIPLIAWFLLGDDPYKDGLIFIAATPFAASVVPLSYIVRGDLEHAARGTIVAYLASIIYIPALVLVTLGKSINITADIFLPAISIGTLSVGVLNINNMRDCDNDKVTGKNTIVVKIGISRAKYYHTALLVTALGASLLYVFVNHIQYKGYLFVFLLVPLMTKHLLNIFHFHNGSLLDTELKKLALITILFSLAFGAGINM